MQVLHLLFKPRNMRGVFLRGGMDTKLILLRHGRSVWNRKNLFTGWVDIPLDEGGIEEAYKAGDRLKEVPIDVVFTSKLIRAQMTIPYVFFRQKNQKVPLFLHPEEKWSKVYSEKALEDSVPVHQAAELNERMYGALQGLNKKEMAEKYGEDQVHRWRRSFEEAPPEGESLKICSQRTIPYFEKAIAPVLKEGKNVLVAAHGNSLRSIIMHIEALSEKEVTRLEIATGDPLIYRFSEGRYDVFR